MNEGLKEVGKDFITIANLMFVLFLLNIYLQKNNFSIMIVIVSIYGVISLYFMGYYLINKSNKKDN